MSSDLWFSTSLLSSVIFNGEEGTVDTEGYQLFDIVPDTVGLLDLVAAARPQSYCG